MKKNYIKIASSLLATVAATITIYLFVTGLFESDKLKQKENKKENLVEKITSENKNIEKTDTINDCLSEEKDKDTQPLIINEETQINEEENNPIKENKVDRPNEWINIRRTNNIKDKKYLFDTTNINYEYIKNDSTKNKELKKKIKIDQ